MFMTIESAAGRMIAAPMPWTPRIVISVHSFVDSAQPSDASVKTASPIMKMRRRPEQVGRTAAEQQQAAERQPVGGDDPLQVRLGEVELLPDSRQRDVDDREVGDRHEERNGEKREGAPAVNGCGSHGGRTSL